MVRIQHFLCFLGVILSVLGLTSAALNTDYVANTVDAVVDATSTPANTFKLRYFKNDKSFTKSGPLFVYIGGQYSLDKLDPLNVNLLDQIATKFNATIVVVEHRFYGESKPYGADTDIFTNINKIKNLDISLVLEDIYAVVKKESAGMADEGQVIHPVLFGVGYSGLLATLYNYKYQNDENRAPAGSWASSFHLNDFIALNSIKNTYDADLMDIFTKEFGCKKSAIIGALQALQNLPTNELATIFGNLSADSNIEGKVKALADFCAQTIRDIASINYPFIVNRFGKDVPQYPAKVFCDKLNTESTEAKAKVQALRDALVNAYLSPGPNASNFKVDFDLSKILENKGLSPDEMKAKTWQHCTQLAGGRCAAMQAFTDNFGIPCTPNDLLDFTQDRCKTLATEYALTAYYPHMHYKPQYVTEQFGIDYKMPNRLPVLKKAVIAGGNWDPKFKAFSSDSVSQYNDSFYVFKISSATTGQDLFGPNTCDPESVAEARTQIVDMLECWTKSSPPERCTKKEATAILAVSGKVNKQECEVCNKNWPWMPIDYKDKTDKSDSAKTDDSAKKTTAEADTSGANDLIGFNTLLLFTLNSLVLLYMTLAV